MLDARGRSCPEPVIMIKKAMMSKEAHYEMTVDNPVAVENVTRFAQHSGYTVKTTQSGNEFILKMDRK
ncbi:MAG: sulfurtransferase TusA family protein [Blautia sp.]|nr:sulfurtransferase TusA family protein [Clostridia bacterium]MDY4692098.1 sulfurtransferase TusA family protein [Blautia sp.]MDY5556042.1 sulfurtransferase TusA family protein [Blautia sp.]